MDKGPTSLARAQPLWSGRLTLILSGSIALLAFIGWQASRSLDTLTLRADWLNHTERVRYEIGAALQSLTDIETGERGYAISGDDSFLQPFQAARASLTSDLGALRQLTSDNPRQQVLIDSLSAIAQQRLDQAQAVV